jgi:hypothetical protein
MVLLIDKKQQHKRWVLTEEKFDDIGVRLEHTHRKSLKHLAQDTGVSESLVQERQHDCWSLDPMKQH